MATILFVHGTGVRRESYEQTLAVIRLEAEKAGVVHRIEECLWGDSLGALPAGASIPGYAVARSIGGSTAQDEMDALWSTLWADPMFEIRLLPPDRAASGPQAPNAVSPGRELWRRLQTLTDVPEVDAAGLRAAWPQAVAAIVQRRDTELAVVAANPAEGALALARALVAHAMRLTVDGARPAPMAEQRDELVDALVVRWGGKTRFIGSAIGGVLKSVVAWPGTLWVKHKRNEFSDSGTLAAGDILRYQARGQAIRDFIWRKVDEAGEPVILLAHSLGGIACVDLLVEQARSLQSVEPVTHLITVGSQAPYLKEINALVTLPHDQELPRVFPPWLNIFDRYDFLSYEANPVFPGRAQDFEVASGQPFPASHSAYWRNPATWQEIVRFLR